MPTIAPKIISARVSPELHKAANQLARSRGLTMNQLIESALSAELRKQEEKRLFDAFTLLGQDSDEVDVEFALSAQNEVVNHG